MSLLDSGVRHATTAKARRLIGDAPLVVAVGAVSSEWLPQSGLQAVERVVARPTAALVGAG